MASARCSGIYVVQHGWSACFAVAFFHPRAKTTNGLLV